MGCCDNDSPINFSLLTMPPDFYFPLNLKDIRLWAAAFIVYFAAYFRTLAFFVLKKLKVNERDVILSLGVTLISHLVLIVSFFKGIKNQPEAEVLQSNLCMYVGYLLFAGGALLSAKGYGYILMEGEQLLDLQAAVPLYYHHTEYGIVLIVFGLSIVKASVAGGMLAFFSALAFFGAYTFESDLFEGTSRFFQDFFLPQFCQGKRIKYTKG